METLATKKLMKRKCEIIGNIMLFIVFSGVIFLVIKSVILIYALLQTSDQAITIEVINSQAGLLGYSYFNDVLSTNFGLDVLNEKAVNSPRLVFFIGGVINIISYALILIVFVYIKKMFDEVTTGETPFTEKNSKSLFQVGIILLIEGIVDPGLLSVICMICGVGGGSQGNYFNYDIMLIGGVIMSLSYIFKYGGSLQQESDETL